MPPPRLSIVIAVETDGGNLPAIRAALEPPRHPDVEFVFCHARAGAEGARESGDEGNVFDVCGGERTLIPGLWRDGIRAARGRWVATTTAHFVPAGDWVERLLALAARSAPEAAAFGGVFVNAADAQPLDWAIFVLRYAAYAAPQAPRAVTDVAADNALYRRDLILRHPDLLNEGFWEPSFHARFRAEQFALRLEPALQVVHRNRYRARAFLAQRIAHGRRFGHTRATALPLAKRIGYLVVAPGLPLLYLRKVVLTASRHPVCAAHLWPALGWMLVFLGGWGWGEARGYVDALIGSKPR